MVKNFKIKTICVVGLGYVGLPLALEFSKFFEVIGFDLNKEKIQQLKENKDATGGISRIDLKKTKIFFTSNPKDIKKCDFISICVPTPVDKTKKPDFNHLKSASEIVGRNLKKGAIVVYESTVYPGATEEVCLPVLEKYSGQKSGQGFKIGYSPERINPGDKEHTINKIVKVVAGQDNQTTEILANVYGKITKAGVHKAPNIKTAEAAKVIENIQRDLNIALMNELSKIFSKMGIRTKDVLDAAGTKWNFQKYYPGLVGGHCIGVDPYYLTHKAQKLGYCPEVILAGRKINDKMHHFILKKLLTLLNKAGKIPLKSKVLIMGLTFKENVPDPRNSRIKYLIKELKELKIKVLGLDPLLSSKIVKKEFGIKNYSFSEINKVDAVIVSSPHKEFSKITLNILKKKLTNPPILIDLKGMFNRKKAENKGFLFDEF